MRVVPHRKARARREQAVSMEDPARERAAKVRRGARVAADGHQRVPREEASPDVRGLKRPRDVEEVHR